MIVLHMWLEIDHTGSITVRDMWHEIDHKQTQSTQTRREHTDAEHTQTQRFSRQVNSSQAVPKISLHVLHCKGCDPYTDIQCWCRVSKELTGRNSSVQAKCAVQRWLDDKKFAQLKSILFGSDYFCMGVTSIVWSVFKKKFSSYKQKLLPWSALKTRSLGSQKHVELLWLTDRNSA